MGCCRPEIPPDAKQTNCWSFIFISFSIMYGLQVIGLLISYYDGGVKVLVVFDVIINYIIFCLSMYHLAYVRINVQQDNIDITMGPLRWCVFGWCCSSQITKPEIVLITRKQRQCLWDIIPRFYCSPIQWCCCHKSYSSYFWPCCCNDCSICGCCEGDSDSSDMIQIHLTNNPWEFSTMCCKRCGISTIYPAISICWCCVYNRITVSIKNEQIINELQSCGYPLNITNQLIVESSYLGTDGGNTDTNYQGTTGV